MSYFHWLIIPGEIRQGQWDLFLGKAISRPPSCQTRQGVVWLPKTGLLFSAPRTSPISYTPSKSAYRHIALPTVGSAHRLKSWSQKHLIPILLLLLVSLVCESPSVHSVCFEMCWRFAALIRKVDWDVGIQRSVKRFDERVRTLLLGIRIGKWPLWLTSQPCQSGVHCPCWYRQLREQLDTRNSTFNSESEKLKNPLPKRQSSRSYHVILLRTPQSWDASIMQRKNWGWLPQYLTSLFDRSYLNPPVREINTLFPALSTDGTSKCADLHLRVWWSMWWG